MWSITITLGQLRNQGICKKCNKGNYRYVMMTLTNWNDILNIFNMTFNYQCNHCI